MRTQNINSDVFQNQFTAYLKTALINNRTNYLKLQNSRTNHEMMIIEDLEFESEDFSIEYLEKDALKKALKCINEKERIILIAHTVEKKTFNDISCLLGIKRSTATMSYYRTLEKMRLLLLSSF